MSKVVRLCMNYDLWCLYSTGLLHRSISARKATANSSGTKIHRVWRTS